MQEQRNIFVRKTIYSFYRFVNKSLLGLLNLFVLVFLFLPEFDNFLQFLFSFRITDHRINYTIYNLSAFMDGDIQDVIDHLIVAENAERLKESEL